MRFLELHLNDLNTRYYTVTFLASFENGTRRRRAKSQEGKRRHDPIQAFRIRIQQSVRWHLHTPSELRSQVSLKTIHRHTRADKVGRGEVRAVKLTLPRLPSAADEQPREPACAVYDGRAGVPRLGEGVLPRPFGAAWEDGERLRRLPIMITVAGGRNPGERAEGVEAADGEPGGGAALDDHDALRVIVVIGVLRDGLPHLLVWDGAAEL